MSKRTEIREYGDKQTLVVYTQDSDLCKELRQWDSCQAVREYLQRRESNRYLADVIAWDLYFPRRMRRQLRRACGITGKHKKGRTSVDLTRPEGSSISKDVDGDIISSSYTIIRAGR